MHMVKKSKKGLFKVAAHKKVLVAACLAIACLIVYSALQQNQPNVSEVSAYSTPSQPTEKVKKQQEAISIGTPTRITFPDLGVDVGVAPGVYDEASSSWSLNSKTAHYAQSTPPVNSKAGNTLIYGHNNRFVLGPIVDKLKPGMKAVVITKQNQQFIYSFDKEITVEPDDVDAIKNTFDPTLTVQTCVGSYYEQRRLFQFSFEKVEQI